jgi:hypothetical protein
VQNNCFISMRNGIARREMMPREEPMQLRITLLICLVLLTSSLTAHSGARFVHSAELVRPRAVGLIAPQPHPILSDVNVRRAIAHCTDKGALLESVHSPLTPQERQALIAETFVISSSWAFTMPATTYPFNPSLGAGLLDASGWILPAGGVYRTKNGKLLSFGLTTTDNDYRRTYLAVWINQMRTCGIKVMPNYVTARVWFGERTGLRVRDFESTAFAWIAEDDPGGQSLYACDQIPSPTNEWSGQNYMGWCNTAASTALQQAANAALPQAQRKQFYATVINEFANDVPSLPLFFRPNSAAWEHIDFSLETYSQEGDLTVGSQTTLNFADYANNTIVITAPSAAVSQTTELRFDPLISPTLSTTPGSNPIVAFRLTALIANVPQPGFAFNAPITLTVSYPPSLTQAAITGFALYYLDVTSNQWRDSYESCPESQRYRSIDIQGGHYTVRVCHLTEFALFGRPWLVHLPMVVRSDEGA